MSSERGALGTLAACAALAAALSACGSGSGGSDVDSHSATPPTARVEVLNGGTSRTFREGAEVLLTGKASEDRDGPLIAWSFAQTAGPSVRLLEVNNTTVRFTAPSVDSPSTVAVQLTVEDSTRNFATATAEVHVLPARDSDKFLSLDVARGASFDTFEIVAALAGGAATGSATRPFTLSVSAYVVYPTRAAPGADCTFDAADFAGGVPHATATGCAVEPLQELGRFTGAWPAGVEAPVEPDSVRITRWWNPRFTLPVPRLDVQELNQRFVDAHDRARLLDGFAAHRARIVLSFELAAPDNQRAATIVFPGLVYGPPDAVPASSIANGGVGLPTAAFVPLDALLAAIDGREAALTAAVYYETVDPTRTRRSLNAWLRQAGFTAADGTLLPEAVAGTGEFAHAVYVNNFDLGFGRQMYTRTDALGNVFSFVKNYATLEGAIRQLDSFATVVTEYSPLVNHTDSTPKFVKFFTYVEDGSGDAPLVASFDFDGRGERFTPGNCVVCHGGARSPGVAELVYDAACGDRGRAACYAWPARNRDGEAIATGDLGGTFLPWDVGSLLFADTDPAITQAPLKFDGESLQAELTREHGDFSRAKQLPQLKKLNQAAYRTYTERHDAAQRLVESWYGGVDANGMLVSDTFDDAATIAGWRNGETVPDPSPLAMGGMLTNPANAEELYHGVYARHCRMCHTSMPDGPLRFETYQEFVFQGDAIRQTVYRSGSMPGARLTMDRFWVPFDGGVPAGERLAAHLAALRAEPADVRPGAAAAVIVGLDPPSARGATVYLDGGNSAFATSYAWALTAPAGSGATLSSADSRHSAFVPDLPGVYQVTLTVNAGTSNESVATGELNVVNRPPVAVGDVLAADLAASRSLTASVLAGAYPDADPDGDRLIAALAAAPSYGTVSMSADGSFVYAYTGALPAPERDAFEYEIADGFGGTARAAVMVLLPDAAASERPLPPTALTAVDASTAAGDASTFAVRLQWAASGAGVQSYNIYRNGALLASVPSGASGGAVTYVDGTALPDTTYVYRVTAVDGTSESAPSDERAVAVTPSLRQNIQTGWGPAAADSLWRATGCVGCHRGAAGGLTLGGTPESVAAELVEDAADPSPRRVEPAEPMWSRLLCKPLIKSDPASCPHEGGAFLTRSDPRFQLLRRWIERNAPNN